MIRTNHTLKNTQNRIRTYFILAMVCLLIGSIIACSRLDAENPPNTTQKEPIQIKSRISFVTDEDALSTSIHQDLDCEDCHEDIEYDDNETAISAGLVDCEMCHDEPAAEMEPSIHVLEAPGGDGNSARCQDCHGAHDILGVDDPNSKLTKRRVSQTCKPCHGKSSDKAQQPSVYDLYLGSVHGQSLVKEGTIVSPSCTDCHGSHAILASSEEDSETNHGNVAQLCGTCHLGIQQSYEKSIHGELVEDGEEEAPHCGTCHNAHDIQATDKSFASFSDQRCGSCHEKAFLLHQNTYHGRIKALGGSNVAGCYNCHGSHEVVALDSPASPLSAANKIQTCRKCHEDAPDAFAGYFAHGDPDDRAGYPLLFWTTKTTHMLILAAFVFLILHTIGWNIRKRRFQPDMDTMPSPKKRSYRMFRGVDRLCYSLILTGFALLAVSGLPMKFCLQEWAQLTFKLLGGSVIASGIHRLGAIIVFTAFIIHIASLVMALWKVHLRNKQNLEISEPESLLQTAFGPTSPLPGWRDLKQLWYHSKWMVGWNEKPKVTGLLYWEKLDYLAMIIAISILAMSGLAMWLPTLVTLVFPGWILNFSQIIHSNEALLALLFFAFIHLTHYLNHRPSSLHSIKEEPTETVDK